MKANNKNSHQSWLESNFKKSVRYILSDLEQYPCFYRTNEHERELLKRIIHEYKQFCVDLYKSFEKKNDFSNYVTELEWGLKVKWNVETIWVDGEYWEDPDCIYNSLHIEFDDYDFQLKEQAYDDYLCEMCETHGRGYDYLDQYVKQCDEQGEELPF